jgi:hypothetical protein
MYMRTLLTWVLWVFLAATSAAQSPPHPLPHQAAGQSLGTVNCSNSMCHGSVVPWKDAVVLRNEYTTWSRLDKHSQAYDVLLNPTSQRIAKNLGLKEPAHESKLCLDCHAHYPAPAQRGNRFLFKEGVSCEACHGPAGPWIEGHIEKGSTHARNVSQGLYPLTKPVDQARLCLSCHLGDASRFVTHRIMGAGHPRMSFELTTFTAMGPAHYRVDDDYLARKGATDPVRVWAIGQVLAVQTQLDALMDPKRNYDGVFPELVLFDCHACHRPMAEQRWSTRSGTPPGVIRLNHGHLVMLKTLVATFAPQLNGELDQAMGQLNQSLYSRAAANALSWQEAAKQLHALAGKMVPVLEKAALDRNARMKILLTLIDESRVSGYADYANAEQAYMAIVGVSNGLIQDGSLKLTADIRSALSELKSSLAHDEKYQAKVFEQRLTLFRQQLANSIGVPR